MTRILRIVFLLLAIQAYEANAGSQSITVGVADVPIYVPAPQGFHEISELSPETRRMAEKMTPPDNRLLAVFVSESDLGRIMKGEMPQFGRYMLLQVRRQRERTDVSGSQFQQLASQIKKQQETLLEKAKGEAGSLLSEAANKLSKEHGVAIEIQVGEQVPLGIFLDMDNAIGFAMLGKYQVTSEGQQLDDLVATGASILRVKNKILYAYVYGDYEGQSDLEWVRSTSGDWVNQILLSNTGASRGESDSGIDATFDWHQTIDNGIVGAVAGALFVLVVAVVRRVKRTQKSKKG